MDNHLPYWFLRNHDLTTQSGDHEIRQLTAIAKLHTFEKDDVIYSSHQEIESIYLLCQGRIKIAFSIENHEDVVAEILKEGDIFGELTLKKSANNRCEFAQVLSAQAYVISFNLKEFENMLKKNHTLAIEFSRILAEKIKIITAKFCSLAYTDVRARVLNFFKLHAQYEGKWTGSKAEIKMFCTQKDIANFTASTRPTVSAIINDLISEKKIIYEGRSKVIIPDINQLNI